MADLYGISLDYLVDRNFSAQGETDVEQKIINYIKKMDDKGKELSLGLVSQVVQHQGNDNGSK